MNFKINSTLIALSLIISSCSKEQQIIEGQREPIFNYEKCEECYNKKIQNKSIKLTPTSPKLSNTNKEFKEITSFKIGEVEKRRTGENYVIAPQIHNNKLYTISNNFELKEFDLNKNLITNKKTITIKNKIQENIKPVGLAVDKEGIFISSSNGLITAISHDTFKTKWEEQLEEKTLKSAPVLSKKFLLITSSDNILHGLRKKNGNPTFTHKGLPLLTSFEGGATAALTKNENILVPFSNGEIHYLTSNGRYLFSDRVLTYKAEKIANPLFDIIEKPIINNNKAIIAGNGHQLKVINLLNGQTIWKKTFTASSAPTVKYGYVFIKDNKNNLFAFGEDSSKLYWKTELPKFEKETDKWISTIENNGNIILLGTNGNLLTINGETGKTLSNINIAKISTNIKPLFQNNKIIITTTDGEIKIFE